MTTPTPSHPFISAKTARRPAAHLGLGLLLAGACAATAHAQGFDAVRLYGAKIAEDGATIGIGAVYAPKYMGAKDYHVQGFPLIDYRWANGFFAGSGNGIGYNFAKSGPATYGLRLTADLGRKESLDARLRGMGDVDIRPEAGAFFNYALAEGLEATHSLRYGSGQAKKGLVADFGISYTRPVAPRFLLGVGVGASVVNAEHMQSYFGVNTQQSQKSGWAFYSPKAGLRDARINLLLSYALSERSGFSLGVSANQLGSEAKASPLTQKSRSLSAFGGFSYLL
ncbi:MipA/OmpV family protein [Roseateles sp.]|uniref:MipA/OmpV family protein n=1 Tax=Roseateles sp. TaxID=1971397 RepID=UPI003BA65E61